MSKFLSERINGLTEVQGDFNPLSSSPQPQALRTNDSSPQLIADTICTNGFSLLASTLEDAFATNHNGLLDVVTLGTINVGWINFPFGDGLPA